MCALSIIKQTGNFKKFPVCFTATSCPTDRGDRLKAVRLLLMCQLSCRYSISMMLQACLLLQHLPLLQEVRYIPFSYIVFLFFSCYLHGQETPPMHFSHYNKWDKKVQIQGLRRRKNRSLLVGK